MTVKTRFFLTDPKSANGTLTLTMTLSEWDELRKQLQDVYPSWKLSGAIAGLILQAQEHFSAHTDSE